MSLNDLSGKSWAKLSKSVWINQKLLSLLTGLPLSLETFCLVKKLIKGNSAMTYYRPLDENRMKLIELFTKKNQVVFDPLLEYGDTMEAALFVHRQFIGVGKTEKQCEKAKARCHELIKENNTRLLLSDNHLDNLENSTAPHSIDFILTELPPFDFIEEDYEAHLAAVQKDFQQYAVLLKDKAYIALIVSDRRYHTRYYAYHADVAKRLENIGFIQQGLMTLIHDTNPIKSYGYPTTFVPNIVNQFVVILRKF